MEASTVISESDRESLTATFRATTVATPSDLTWDVLRGDASLTDTLLDEWNAVCDSGQFPSRLLRPAVVRAYLNAFFPGAPVVMLTARQHGRLVAMLPLVERTIGPHRLGLRWLRMGSNLQVPRMDAMSCHEDPEQIAREIWGVLRVSRMWDVLQIDAVPPGGIADRVRELAEQDGYKTHPFHPLHHHEKAPRVSIPREPTLDSVIEAQRKSLRKQLRRDLKRIQEMGQLRFTETSIDAGRDRLAEAYQQFVELEDRSWKGRDGGSIRKNPGVNDFFMNLINAPDLNDQFRVHTLTCDNEPVAIAIGLVGGTTHFSCRISYNDAYRACSPGQLLILHQLQALGEQGFEALDLGGGFEEYKLAWTGTMSPMAYPFIFRKGIRGSTAHAATFWLWPRLQPITGNKRLRQAAGRVLR